MEQDNKSFITNVIKDLRLRLLDLTNRNALLNFRHSEKALTHIRIIDELPDFLFGSLIEGKKLTFLPLPEPDDEPHDEKTEEFQTYFREATLTDEKYLEEVAALIDKDDSFDDLAEIERNLKNRVRERLGMPPVHELKPLSNAKWARQNGLEPKYDMPEPSQEDYKADKHYDEYVQTLLKPKELRHKLSGLRRYINTDINETGVNTFYAAFGFLERYDSKASEKPFYAPLVLLQLDPPIEKKTLDGEVFTSIEASGEDPQFNLPLAEKLKEFGLNLPELAEDDTPESYMNRVERLIKNQKGWRVRRFITIGRFQFARLVMYHDLNPDRWPESDSIEENEIIKSLIAGGNENSGASINDVATIYEIDTDPEVDEAAPVLIMEADSSQHSAIVDAMKGNNLVIKGPPGTGKSQTITNLIANALDKGKKVLFIAEKMAALNVVHSRLQGSGLGDFCFELHSTKAKLKDIKEDLATTIENRKANTRPRNLQQQISEIKETKAHLREYSDVVNQPFGESGKTIHEIMWSEQRRRDVAELLPVSVKTIKIKHALSFSEEKLQGLTKELAELEILESQNNAYSESRHPWTGVSVPQAGSLRAQEIIQAFEESSSALEILLSQTRFFEENFQWSSNKTITDWINAKRTCSQIKSLEKASIDFELVKNLKNPRALTVAEKLQEILRAYDIAMEAIKREVKTPDVFTRYNDKTSKHCKLADDLNFTDKTADQIYQSIKIKEAQLILWEKASEILEKIGTKIFGPSTKHNDHKNLLLFKRVIKVLGQIERDLLFLRHKESINEAHKPALASAISDQKNLKQLQAKLERQFDLKFDIAEIELREAVYHLSTANVWSFLKPTYYKAWKTFRSASISPERISTPNAANLLRQLKAFKEEKCSFENNANYRHVAGTAFNGLNTNFVGLDTINSWATNVRQEFSGLEPCNDYIKNFLLYSEVADIEGFKREISEIDIERLLDETPINDQLSLPDLINQLKSDLQKTKEAFDYLRDIQAHNDLTYETLKALLNGPGERIQKYLKFLEGKNRSFQEALGSFFKNENTDRSILKNSISLIKHLIALDLPSSLDSTCHSHKIFSLAGELTSLLDDLDPYIEKGQTTLNIARDVSNLDVDCYIGASSLDDAPLTNLKETIETSLNNKEALNSQLSMISFLERAKSSPYSELLEALKREGLSYRNSSKIFEYLYYRTICQEVFKNHENLDTYKHHWLADLQGKFKELDRKIINLNCQELAYKLSQTQPPEGNHRGRVSEYSEMGLIRHQALKEKTRAIPIRKLLSRAGKALQALKPCFLMSPLSVAQYISPHGIKFDLVVIDEASQMRPEDALGAIGRSGQIVVVGDPKQLPPTAFFSKQTFTDADYEDEDKVDNESILDLAIGRFRPTRDLLWHYRSRHESLIAFSNAHFYDDRLIIFPSPENRSENFGVHCHYIGGTYNASCNIDETKAVMEAARKFMHNHPDKSLGIATMNSPQRDLIYEEMYRLFLNDEIAEAYRQKWEGTLEPFFVKNLESVQGDERDVIFVSTVYGPNKDGQVMQRFGPINGKHGHRRLNVLFTRAKHNLVLFTSLRPDDIKATETSALGLRAFKGYLEYVFEGKLDAGTYTEREPDSDFEICVKERLESIGCEIVPQVGVAGYFIDLGVRHPDYPYGFMMGIECDGAMYHSSKSARDRDRIRQEVLEGLGWEIYRIWSTDWFHNPTAEFNKLKAHIEETLERKISEREELETERLSNVINLQKQTQTQLFSDLDDQKPTPSTTTYTSEPINQQIPSNDNLVELFDTVSYQFLDDREPTTRIVTIVPSQSDIETGHINQHSAIGRALVGSHINDEIEVDLPDGSKIIQVIKIRKFKE